MRPAATAEGALASPVSDAEELEESRPSQRGARFSSLPFQAMVVLGLHVPLGIAMQASSLVATAHAGLTLLVALYIAMGPRVERLVYAAAYFCGSEVLWRMTHARSPWEFGKYGVILIFAIGLVRQRPIRVHWPALAFIALLLPSAVLTMLGLDAHEARSQIAFNLAGPVALAVSVAFLATVNLGPRERRRVALALTAPLVAIGTITAVGTYLVGGIKFGTESNFASSGGFGPNQVSGILAFGALVALLSSFDRRAGQGFKLIMLGLTLVLIVQSAMTFSRGGLMVTAVAGAIALLHLLRDRGARLQLVTALVVFALGGIYVVIPRLNSFTGGALGARFEDHNLTKRDDVIRDDIDIWLANPMLGVGPGMAKTMRARSNVGAAPVAAHTEFSRLVAEHGLLGLFALILLVLICFNAWRRARTAHTRALATAYLAWGMLFMGQSGMRLVAPSLALGLAYAVGRGTFAVHKERSKHRPRWFGSAYLMLKRANRASPARTTAPAALQVSDSATQRSL